MNRRNTSVVAALLLGGIIVVVTNIRTGESQTSTEALSPREISLLLASSAMPPVGQCVEVLITESCPDAGGRCASNYKLCSLPPDAGADAGWVQACHAGDAGEQVCEAIPSERPPEPTPAEEIAQYSERKCRRAAKEVCTLDGGDREGWCVDRGTEECLRLAQESGGVRRRGVPYSITTETKTLDRLSRKQVRASCACAPHPDLRGDAGEASPCKEWITFMGVDGGDWKRAAPGHVIPAGAWKGAQCEPSDCNDTEARESGHFALDPLCLIPDASL